MVMAKGTGHAILCRPQNACTQHRCDHGGDVRATSWRIDVRARDAALPFSSLLARLYGSRMPRTRPARRGVS